MSKGRFQILRTNIVEGDTPAPLRYRFELKDMQDKSRTVAVITSSSPIAPAKIRAYQAKLNTNSMLGSI